MTVTPEARSTAPRRRCLARRTSQPREKLIRFVVGPDGRLVPDLCGRLPGRGLWLSADRDLLLAPRTRRNLARAGMRNVDLEALRKEVERLLERRCLELLGLARRAGRLVAGFEKVREQLARGKVAVLLVARDAGANARRRFLHLPPGTERVEIFDKTALGRALGRAETVHVAVMPGRLAQKLVAEVHRLDGLRGLRPPTAPADGTEGSDLADSERTHASEETRDR